MAQKFTITAELNLQTKNIGQVVDNLKKQFQGADLNIKIKDLAKAESQMRGLSKTTGEAERSVSSLGGSIATAAKKFSAITLATGTLVGFTRAIKNAVGDAIEFEREIVKIAQATGKTVGQLKSLQNEVSSVASSLGVSSKELILAARSLTQAGFAADKVTGALRVLAQTEVAATFDSIADTTEGAIALLNQFGRAAQRTGSEVEFLERSLSAINQVSKDFAVESSDLITAVRTTGSAFESAGGSLNELLALFTSVRSTTRESAESIATGFRTIFTRVQRVDTINALRNLGIELQDVEGKFVGPMEATKRLSTALSTIDPRDFRFNLIVEELGGFRQVSKVIPLIQQFAVAQKALNVAQNSSGSLAKDAATAQQALSVQIAKTKENFQAFVRELVDSSSFQNTVKSLLSLADSFIRVADTIKPLIPLIAGFAAIKVGQALGSSFLSVAGGRNKKAQGGKIHAFASGGMVPGSGNGDTVPAMLTPGEFVIRKSSVKKLGAENLARANKYAGGGEVQFYKNAGEVKPNKVSSSVKKAIPASQIDNDYVENTDRPYINLIRQPILLNNKDKKKLGQAYGIPKEYKVAGNGERYGVYSRQTTTSKKDIYRIFEDLVVSKNKEWELNNTTNISDEVDVIKKNQTGNILDIGDVKFTSSPVGKQKLLKKATQWMVKQDNNSSSRRFFKENLKNKIDSPGVQFTVFEPPFEEGFSKNAILESMGLPRDTTEAYYNKINSKVQKFALGGPAGKSRAARAITIPRIDSYTFDKPAGADLDSVNSKKQQYKLNAEDRLDYDVNNVNVDVSKLKVSKDLLEQYNTADDQKRGYRFEDILKETGMAKSLSQVSNARLDGITAAGDPFEAKSRKSAIGISELEDKLYGAISDNISDPEKLARARFNANDLTEKEDHIKIGKVTVFEDVTRGLGAAVNTKARMGYAEEEAAKQAKEQNKMASVNAQQTLQDLVKNNFGSGFIIQGKQYSPVTKSDKVHPDVPTNLNQLLGGKYQDTIGLEGGPAKVLGLLKKFIVRNPVQNKASGGSIASLAWLASGGAASGTDTVPAMLTPGEYVINKKSAQAIGSSALNRMNKVGKFASGGPVGVQNFAGGGDVVARTVQTARLNKFLSGPGASQLSAIDPKEAQKVVEVLRKIAEGGRDIPKALKYVEEQIKKQGANFKLDYKGLSQAVKAPKEAPSVKLSDQLKDLTDNTGKSSTNLLLMASVAESAVAQLSGFSDEVKNGLSAFGATFATYKLVGDNLKNLATDIYIAKLKRQEETNAINKSTSAHLQHAAAIKGQASPSSASNSGSINLGKIEKALNIFDGAATGFAVGMGLLARETAYYSTLVEKSGKKLDKLIEDVFKKPELSSKASVQKETSAKLNYASMEAAIKKNQDSTRGILTMLTSVAAGAATGAAFAAPQGAAAGAAAGPAGIASGTTIATIAGGTAGGFAAYKAIQAQSQADAEAAKDSINKAAEAITNSLFASANGIKKAQKFLEDLEKKTPQEINAESISATKNYITALDAATEAEKRAVSLFGSLEKAPEAFRSEVNRAAEAASNFGNELDKVFGARKQAVIKEVTSRVGTAGFDPVKEAKLAGGREFIQNFLPKAKAEVNQKYQPKIDELRKAEGKSGIAKDISIAAGNELANKANELAVSQAAQATYEFQKSILEASVQVIKQKEALIALRETTDKLVGTIIQQIALESALKNFEYSIKKADTRLSQIGANFGGSVSGLKPNTPDSSVLDNIIPNASNMADYQNALKAIASIGPAGQKISDNFQDLNKVIPNFKAKMAQSQDFRTGMSADAIDKFIAGLGVNAGGEVGQEIKKMIQTAVAPGGGAPQSPEQLAEKIAKELDQYAEMLKGSGKRILDAITANEQSTAKAYDEINASRQRQLDLQMQSIDGYEKLVKNVAAAQGRTLSLIEKNNLRFNRQRMLAGNMAGNPVGIGKRLGEIRGKLGADNVGNLNADQRAALQNEAGKLTQALKELADQSGRTADTLEEIEKIKAQREAVKDAAKEYTFGGVEERAKLEQSVQALGQVMATGNIDSIPDELKSGVQSLLDRFKDVPMFNGMTGKQVENKLIANKMREIGANDAANMIEADTSTPEQKLTQELYRIAAEEQAARQQLFNQEAQQQAMQMDVVNKNTAALQQLSADLQAEKKKLDQQQQAGVNELGAKKEKEQLAAQKKELEDRRKFIDEQLKITDESIKKLINTVTNISTALSGTIDKLEKDFNAARDRAAGLAGGAPNFAPPPPAAVQKNKAQGGLIYAAKGQLVNFQPKGTDTVPAMLTPGEFVMRKAAVQKYGGGMMKAINAGRFEAGGPAAPGDGDGGGGTTGGGTTGGGDTGVSPTPRVPIKRIKRPRIFDEDRAGWYWNDDKWSYRDAPKFNPDNPYATLPPKIDKPYNPDPFSDAPWVKGDPTPRIIPSPEPPREYGPPFPPPSDYRNNPIFRRPPISPPKPRYGYSDRVAPEPPFVGPPNPKDKSSVGSNLFRPSSNQQQGSVPTPIQPPFVGPPNPIIKPTPPNPQDDGDRFLPWPNWPEKRPPKGIVVPPGWKWNYKSGRLEPIPKPLPPILAAKGGMPSATDSIHAMLTPGEFVINKKAAEKIGYDSLKDMNSLQGFAKGGPVGYYAEGDSVGLGAVTPRNFDPAKQQSIMTEQSKLLSFLVRLKDIGITNSLLSEIINIIKGLKLNNSNSNGSAPSITINNNAPATDNNKKITKEDLDKFYKSLQESRDRRSQVNQQQQLQQGTRTGFDTSGAIASPGPIGPRQMAIRARSIKRSQTNQSQNPAKKTRRGKSTKDQPTSTLVDEDFFTTFPDAPKPSPPPVPVERDAQGRKVRPKNSMYTQEQWDAMQKKADAEKKLSDARAKALEDEIAKDLTDNGKRASGVGTVDPRNQKMSPRDRIMKMYGKEGQRPKIFPTDEAWYRDIQKRQNEEDSAANQDLTKRSKKSNEKRGTSDYGKPSALPSGRSQATQDAINKAKELQKSADDLRERQTGLKPGERYQKPSDVPVLTPSKHGTVKPMTPAELDAMEKEAEKAVFTQEELLATQDKALRKMKEDANKVHRNMKKQYEGKDAYSRYLNALGKLNAAKAMRDRYQPKQPKDQSPPVDEKFLINFPEPIKGWSDKDGTWEVLYGELLHEAAFSESDIFTGERDPKPPEPQTPPASPFVEKPQELLEQEKKTAEEAKKVVEEAKKKAQAAAAAAKAQEEARKNQERAAKEAQENQKKAEETARQKAELDKVAQKAREDELKVQQSQGVTQNEPYSNSIIDYYAGKSSKSSAPMPLAVAEPSNIPPATEQNDFNPERQEVYDLIKNALGSEPANLIGLPGGLTWKEAFEVAKKLRQEKDNNTVSSNAKGYNSGGLVSYLARGGSPIFKPKGTDTVPAMLSPGEYVIRKSAVDKIGVDALQSINSTGKPRGGAIPKKNEVKVNRPVKEKKSKPVGMLQGAQKHPGGTMMNFGGFGIGPMGGGGYGGMGTGGGFGGYGYGAPLVRYDTYNGQPFGSLGMQEARNWYMGQYYQNFVQKPNMWARGNSNIMNSLMGNYMNNYYAGRSRGIGKTRGRGFDAHGRSTGGKVNYRAAGGKMSGTMGIGGYAGVDDMIGTGLGNLSVPFSGGFGYGRPLVQYDTYNGQPFGSLSVQEAQNWYMGQYNQNFVQKPAMMAQANNNAFSRMRGNYMNDYAQGHNNYMSNIWAKGGRGGGFAHFKPYHGKSKKGQFDGPGVDNVGGGRRAGDPRAKAKATGGPVYRAGGGSIDRDTVPAMLTPGEFVMNKNAVNKHGMNFMDHLNRGGKVQGFATGGPVYRAIGGSTGSGGGGAPMGNVGVSIDLSAISTTISNSIGAAFSKVGSLINPSAVTQIVSSFSSFIQSMNNMLSKVSGMQMTHTVNISGGISVTGINSQAIANVVSNAVTDEVANLVRSEVMRQFNEIMNQTKSE